MRSKFRIGSAGILFGVLALVLSGCGTFGIGGSSRPVLVGTTFTATDPSVVEPQSKPADLSASAQTQADEAKVTPPTAAAPRSAELASPAAKSEFIPVAFESAPSDDGSYFFNAALQESEPAPVVVAAVPAPVLGQTTSAGPPADAQIEEYDPWEKFNEKMFTFNYNFDKYVLKPVAKGYNFVMPDRLQQMIGHGFDNINVVPKLANNLLQLNFAGFGVELGRFLINSTLGIGGLFDIAKQEFNLEKTKVDFGQTLGKWGVGPGPFLVLPFLPPLTVRDGIGYAADGAMDPLSYVLPFIWDRLGMKIGDTINDRSLNLDLFQGFEETTVDLYSAVRNGYLQRRYNLIHGSGQ